MEESMLKVADVACLEMFSLKSPTQMCARFPPLWYGTNLGRS
jgi:hypothetical protein